MGPSGASSGIDAASPLTGLIHIRYERAMVHMQLAVEPAPPHLIRAWS